MIITISEDWRLASDPLQWILQKRYQTKGEERWRALAFFGDLDRAIVELSRRRILILAGTFHPSPPWPIVANPDHQNHPAKQSLHPWRSCLFLSGLRRSVEHRQVNQR